METTYQRDIEQAAIKVLANSSIGELRAIRVDGTETEIQLSGSVRSFYHKQLAQETVRSVAGSMQVVNLVDVCT